MAWRARDGVEARDPQRAPGRGAQVEEAIVEAERACRRLAAGHRFGQDKLAGSVRRQLLELRAR